jgi:hypothetical protein
MMRRPSAFGNLASEIMQKGYKARVTHGSNVFYIRFTARDGVDAEHKLAAIFNLSVVEIDKLERV